MSAHMNPDLNGDQEESSTLKFEDQRRIKIIFMRIFEKTVNLLTEIIVSEPKAGWPKSSVFNNLDKLDKIPNANFKESKISMCF